MGRPTAAAVPPILDPYAHERYEGFRETTLAVFRDADCNAALRQLGESLYRLGLVFSYHWPTPPEGSLRHQVRAAVADLRHLQGFLTLLAGERTAAVLSKYETRLSRLAERMVPKVREIAN